MCFPEVVKRVNRNTNLITFVDEGVHHHLKTLLPYFHLHTIYERKMNTNLQVASWLVFEDKHEL